MHGLTCGYCKRTVNRETQAEAERVAHLDGWRMVLDAVGQAHYACSGCRENGTDPTPFWFPEPAGAKGPKAARRKGA